MGYESPKTTTEVHALLEPVATKNGYRFGGMYYHGMLCRWLVCLGDGSFNGLHVALMDFIEKLAPELRETIQQSYPYEMTTPECAAANYAVINCAGGGYEKFMGMAA